MTVRPQWLRLACVVFASFPARFSNLSLPPWYNFAFIWKVSFRTDACLSKQEWVRLASILYVASFPDRFRTSVILFSLHFEC